MMSIKNEVDSDKIIDFTGGRRFVEGAGIGNMQMYTSEFLKVLT